MGENPDATVKEIDATRARLDRELDELESRLPGRTTFRRVLRLALGSGVGSAIFWMAVRRLRGRRAERSGTSGAGQQVRVHVVPEEWAREIPPEQVKAFALALATAWLGFKLLGFRSAGAVER